MIGGAVFIVLLFVTGAVYQTVSERIDLREHPAPGHFVDVGGHRLHVHCVGQGSPTVLLEAGLGNGVNHWSLTQPAIAEFTRVCAYDRAGLGWSEAGPLPRSAQQVVHELSRLLDRSGESAPYVLVGHSNGGPYARLYAAAHPQDVAGIVLVDPNPEAECADLPVSTRALYGTLVTLAPVGAPRLLLPSLFPLDGSALSAERREAHGALRARTAALRATWSERQNTCSMLEAVRATPPPTRDLPIVVLSAEARPEGPVDVAGLHREMAEAVGGEFQVVEGSGHWIQLDRPEAVVAAVRDVVWRAREAGGT